MVGLRPSLRPGALAATLAALPVRVDTAQVLRNDVWFLDYPSGPRPSSVLRLQGGGATGRDARIVDERAVAAACARGESVNFKAPRMGGPLELLRGLERALPMNDTAPDERKPAYFGGMFEVSVGRRQAQQLAAIYCRATPNDLALNQPAAAIPRLRSPAVMRLDHPGFGG